MLVAYPVEGPLVAPDPYLLHDYLDVAMVFRRAARNCTARAGIGARGRRSRQDQPWGRCSRRRGHAHDWLRVLLPVLRRCPGGSKRRLHAWLRGPSGVVRSLAGADREGSEAIPLRPERLLRAAHDGAPRTAPVHAPGQGNAPGGWRWRTAVRWRLASGTPRTALSARFRDPGSAPRHLHVRHLLRDLLTGERRQSDRLPTRQAVAA